MMSPLGQGVVHLLCPRRVAPLRSPRAKRAARTAATPRRPGGPAAQVNTSSADAGSASRRRHCASHCGPGSASRQAGVEGRGIGVESLLDEGWAAAAGARTAGGQQMQGHRINLRQRAMQQRQCGVVLAQFAIGLDARDRSMRGGLGHDARSIVPPSLGMALLAQAQSASRKWASAQPASSASACRQQCSAPPRGPSCSLRRQDWSNTSTAGIQRHRGESLPRRPARLARQRHAQIEMPVRMPRLGGDRRLQPGFSLLRPLRLQ